MGYWGWRPLIFGIFISTWVVGCNIVTDNTSPSAAPSVYPHVTLTTGRLPTARVSTAPTRAAPPPAQNAEPSPAPTLYVVQPGDTLSELAAQFGVSAQMLARANGDLATLIPGQTLVIPEAAALPLRVYPPTCYESRLGSLLCLGRVDNPLDFPIENVIIDVNLRDAAGVVYRSERSTIEQLQIPSRSYAPYQTIFTGSWDEFVTTDARLIGASGVAEDRFVTLVIEDLRGERVAARRVVSAVIYNPGVETAELLRAFITLSDEFDRVIGYRVFVFEDGSFLEGGERLPIELELTPQAAVEAPAYLLYIEAQAVVD